MSAFGKIDLTKRKADISRIEILQRSRFAPPISPMAGCCAAIASNSTYVVPPEKRTTEYLESIIGPEIEKNGAPIKAAGMSVE